MYHTYPKHLWVLPKKWCGLVVVWWMMDLMNVMDIYFNWSIFIGQVRRNNIFPQVSKRYEFTLKVAFYDIICFSNPLNFIKLVRPLKWILILILIKISCPEVSTSAWYNIIFCQKWKKLFHSSCMKSDLKNRPLEINRFYGQRRLAFPNFTLGRLAPTRVKFWATRRRQTINTQFCTMMVRRIFDRHEEFLTIPTGSSSTVISGMSIWLTIPAI